MTFHWQWITGPILGAIIGLITNGIAIKMLFRPLYPVKIGKYTLPFTPGLIPKEKPRLAKSIGNVVANQLLNPEVMQKGLDNPEIREKLKRFITDFLGKYKNDHRSIKVFLEDFLSAEQIEYYSDAAIVKLSEIFFVKITEKNLGEMIVSSVYKEFDRRQKEDPNSVNFIRPFLGLFEDKVVEYINTTVANQGFTIIYSFIDDQIKQILEIPISDLYQKGEEYIPVLTEKALEFYHYCIVQYLPTVLKEINLGKLVEDKINDFSLIELEKLLLDLMDKELKAIVYLGGLLGFLMGIVMDFF